MSGVQILTGLVVFEGDGVNRLERASSVEYISSSKLDFILIHLTGLGRNLGHLKPAVGQFIKINSEI